MIRAFVQDAERHGISLETACLAPEHFEILIWPADMPQPEGRARKTRIIP